jgi:F0F1-type ATP synthase membrane subunit b/b'
MYLLAFAESIQLFPDGTIFIHIALVLAMIWILNRTFFRPINRVIQQREKQRFGDGGEAAEIVKDVVGKEAMYDNELLDARSKGYELIEKQQKKASAARDKRMKTAKAAIAEKLDTGRTEIHTQTEAARAELSAEAARMADKIAAGILKG